MNEDDFCWFFERFLLVRGNSDEAAINRMAIAIFNERCPCIRDSAPDYPHYHAAAVAALESLGIIPVQP